MGGASDDLDFDPDRPTKGEPVQYEYDTWYTSSENMFTATEALRKKLNEMSSDGWEVVQIDNIGTQHSAHAAPVELTSVVIFRRPKRPVGGPMRIPGVIYD
ncbi:hypothetical protein CYG49_04785 [Candidatus Saccharibacteria bacterium]|nr:MAG: hypothetical protein CYG49_04785 [Candidatus Saccharibacteria bacterium]